MRMRLLGREATIRQRRCAPVPWQTFRSVGFDLACLPALAGEARHRVRSARTSGRATRIPEKVAIDPAQGKKPEPPGPRGDQAVALLAEGFDMLEEDLDKETFFAIVRRTYWSSADGSPARQLMQTLIGTLDF